MSTSYVKKIFCYMSVVSLMSIPTIKSQADAVFTIASFGVYLINMQDEGNNSAFTSCTESISENPFVSLLCPIAFILEADGSYVMHTEAVEYLKETGLTEEEIKVLEVEGHHHFKSQL